jgi:hypothetical protein
MKTLIHTAIALLAAVLSISAQGIDISRMTRAQKIRFAESAGPAAIARGATIVDITSMRVLRKGKNGWVCYADPMGPACADKIWQAWTDAWMAKTEPKLSGTGIEYMLAGDQGASNTNPFDLKPTKTNHWVITKAHIMIVYSDPHLLDAFSDDPSSGGPWVMWRGTPYSHLMVPVTLSNGVIMRK